MLTQVWLNFILAPSQWYVNVLDRGMTLLCGDTQIQIVLMTLRIIGDGTIPQHFVRHVGSSSWLTWMQPNSWWVNRCQTSWMSPLVNTFLTFDHQKNSPCSPILVCWHQAKSRLHLLEISWTTSACTSTTLWMSTSTRRHGSSMEWLYFALRLHQIITRLLREHRPHWTEAQ